MNTNFVKKQFRAGIVTDCMTLRVFKEPDFDAEVVAVISALSAVKVDLRVSSGEFVKICTDTGIEGFCAKKYIAISRREESYG